MQLKDETTKDRVFGAASYHRQFETWRVCVGSLHAREEDDPGRVADRRRRGVATRASRERCSNNCREQNRGRPEPERPTDDELADLTDHIRLPPARMRERSGRPLT